MRLSRYFMPVLRQAPKEAEILSHRLMLRAGMIRQESAGSYSWLPLGLKVLRNIEQIVREEQVRAGAIELLMPTLQSADLWKKSGRYEAYGKEMLRIKDRHGRDLLYGPTNEEMITDLFRQGTQSYRDLPKILFHIQWKFRDEIRPRFGVMRGREFLMKDSYSFDQTYEEGMHSYRKMFISYLKTFSRMGLKAVPMRAETGPIGGNDSHEFLILAETGESQVFFDREFYDIDWENLSIDYDDTRAVHALVERFTSQYAATEEKHDEQEFFRRVPENRRIIGRGIEVGHIFFFGTKYSLPLECAVQAESGEKIHVESGSYGIGISRLVAAVIEASHDADGILWPEQITPFIAGLLNLKQGDSATDLLCEEIYRTFNEKRADILYDDREERAGSKFTTMDLIGLPWQIIVGPKSAGERKVELKNRRSKTTEILSIEDLFARFFTP